MENTWQELSEQGFDARDISIITGADYEQVAESFAAPKSLPQPPTKAQLLARIDSILDLQASGFDATDIEQITGYCAHFINSVLS